MRAAAAPLQLALSNALVVMLEQTPTKGEQVLVKTGHSEKALALRHQHQEAVREESSANVAERNVIAFLIANHVDPDLAAEIYVLDGPPKNDAVSSTNLICRADRAQSCPRPISWRGPTIEDRAGRVTVRLVGGLGEPARIWCD